VLLTAVVNIFRVAPVVGKAFGSLSLLVCSFHCYSKGGNVCCSRQGAAASRAMRGVEKTAARPKSLTASTSSNAKGRASVTAQSRTWATLKKFRFHNT
jgi:hypothetical protein